MPILVNELLEAIISTIFDHYLFTSLTGSIIFAITQVLVKNLLKRYKSFSFPKLKFTFPKPRITYPGLQLTRQRIQIISITTALFSCLCIAPLGTLYFYYPTSSVQATVVDVNWQTNVPVQEIRAVNYSNESGSPPSDAYNVACRDESQDVCEQKTIDKGNGYSEVVEECHTETQQYCSYTVDEWTTIQTYTLDGNDLQPVYDDPSLASDQRTGDKSEELTVTFSTENGGQGSYSPSTVSEFQQFAIGSTWTLKMNALGGVVSVEP